MKTGTVFIFSIHSKLYLNDLKYKFRLQKQTAQSTFFLSPSRNHEKYVAINTRFKHNIATNLIYILLVIVYVQAWKIGICFITVLTISLQFGFRSGLKKKRRTVEGK